MLLTLGIEQWTMREVTKNDAGGGFRSWLQASKSELGRGAKSVAWGQVSVYHATNLACAQCIIAENEVTPGMRQSASRKDFPVAFCARSWDAVLGYAGPSWVGRGQQFRVALVFGCLPVGSTYRSNNKNYVTAVAWEPAAVWLRLWNEGAHEATSSWAPPHHYDWDVPKLPPWHVPKLPPGIAVREPMQDREGWWGRGVAFLRRRADDVGRAAAGGILRRDAHRLRSQLVALSNPSPPFPLDRRQSAFLPTPSWTAFGHERTWLRHPRLQRLCRARLHP